MTPTDHPLSDSELATRFEDLSLESFPHDEHVRLAWIYLGQAPLRQALDRFAVGLKRFATSKGAADKYHETITWAFFLLIYSKRKPGESFADFAERNTDLMSWKDNVLLRYYSPTTLFSDDAKAHFVPPDILDLPGDALRAAGIQS
jgi:hypothetical protein